MLAVIGGSGFYELEGLNILKEHNLQTPFGAPSAPVVEGEYNGQKILFLSRHGIGHEFLPHEVNYRANIYALKKLGALKIIGFSAAGSLRGEIKPGDLAQVSQYFDHTRGKRDYSFFGNGIAAHVSTANPSCPALERDIVAASQTCDIEIHTGKAYACVEGPRLGTRTESFFLRDAAKCDLVGMTNVPEAFLAREAQMGYCTICLVTDYDCWMDYPEQHVSVEKFFETYGGAMAKAKRILEQILKSPLSQTPDDIRGALKHAFLTDLNTIHPDQKEWIEVLRA